MMHFLWPSTLKHLPNDDQLKLLFALVSKTKFPGFLHTSALKLSESNRQKSFKDGETTIYYTSNVITPEMLGQSLVTSPYVFIPYSTPHSYIMNGMHSVQGIIMRKTMVTYWFNTPISTGELEVAQRRGIPMLCDYINLGTSEPCEICGAYGAVDWVDSTLLGKDHDKVPSDRYIWTVNNYMNFLIDNEWVINYNGDEFIHPCPVCLGLGSSSALTLQEGENEVKNIKLKNKMIPMSSRNTLFRRDEYAAWYPAM